MDFTIFSLGQMQANCYLIEDGGDCILIDPADEGSFILEQLVARRLNLLGQFASHGHFDHVMAAGEIEASLDVPLSIFKEDQFLINRLEDTAKHFLGHEPIVIKPTSFSYLKEGECKLGPFTFEILHIPGHTPGSAAYYFKNEGWLFTGDTLFKETIGRYDFSYSKRDELKKSLIRLLSLPQDTIVYPGHGESTMISDEQKVTEKFNL